MNIDINNKITTGTTAASSSSKSRNDSSAKFSDELSSLSYEKTKETEKDSEVKEAENTEKNNAENETKPVSEKEEKDTKKNSDSEENSKDNTEDSGDINGIIDGLENAVAEINNKLNRTDEKDKNGLKNDTNYADINKKEDNNTLINNDMNITDPKDAALMPQMNANMNFDTNGQPFADFMNEKDTKNTLSSSAKDLAEEQAVLSTMDENLAMANRNQILADTKEDVQNPKTKTVTNSEGIKKVDKNTNVTIETVVKFDSIVMNENDVDFFAKLVENGQTEMSQATTGSSQVSKTLADLIAKSMKDNQPVRIDFDNDISVIIKVGKDGKISADFLPSSQVAEAYLKENLPLLKQKFDDNNIEYDELNQRKQKQDEKDNQKKERKDE